MYIRCVERTEWQSVLIQYVGAHSPVAEADEDVLSLLHIHSTLSATLLWARRDLSPRNPWPLTPRPCSKVGEVGSNEWRHCVLLQACAECSTARHNTTYHSRRTQILALESSVPSSVVSWWRTLLIEHFLLPLTVVFERGWVTFTLSTNFRRNGHHQPTRVPGLSYGVVCMILGLQ